MAFYYRTSKNTGVTIGLIGAFFLACWLLVKWTAIFAVHATVWCAGMIVLAVDWATRQYEARK